MKILDTLLTIVDVVIIGFIIICSALISAKHKYWSYWEQFQRSKDVFPVPAPLQMTPENKIKAIRLWKFIAFAAVLLFFLVIIQFNLKIY